MNFLKQGLIEQDRKLKEKSRQEVQKSLPVQNYGTLPPKNYGTLPPSFMMRQPTGADLINKQIDTGTLPNLPKKSSAAGAIGKKALAGWAGIGSSFEQTAGLMFPTPPITKALGGFADMPMTKAHTQLRQQADKAIEGQNKLTKAAGWAAEGVAGAIPQAAIGLMSGGISAVPQVAQGALIGASKAQMLGSAISNSVQTLAKNPAFWTSFARTAGPTYTEAKQEGANEIEAQATALINGFLGSAVEVGGGLETFKPGGGVKRWVTSMLEEGKEEVLQGIIENLTKKVIYDKGRAAVSLQDDNAVINPLRAGKEFAGGAVVGGILGGAQHGVAKGIDVLGNRVQNYGTLPPKNYGTVPTETPQVTQNYGTLPPKNYGTVPNAINLPSKQGVQAEIQQDRVNVPMQQETGVQGQETAAVTTKGEKYRTKQENIFMDKVAQLLSIPSKANKEVLRPIAQKLANEYMETGDVSKESAEALFEEAYKQGVVVNEDFYNQYKDLKESLKTRRISISDSDKSDIPDYGKFRQRNWGTLKIINDGTPVVVVYQDLNEQYPDLFPSDITHPAEQLQHISEVAKSIEKTESDLDSFLGDDADFFKKTAKHEFEKELDTFKAEMKNVKRYNEDRAKTEKPTTDIGALGENLKSLGKLKRAAERVVGKNVLTDKDNVQVDRLLKGEITLEDVPKNGNYNIKGIKAVYEAKKAPYELEKQLHDYNNQRRAKLHAEAEQDIDTIEEWKNPKGKLTLSLKTAERVFRKIMPEKTAESLIQKYITPIHQKNAAKVRFKNKLVGEVKALNLTNKESEAVQFLGEVDYEIATLQEQQGKRKLPPKKGDRLLELIQAKDKFLSENHGLDMAKINNAINTFRGIYDGLLTSMNEVRIQNGYAPVEYRKGYFPHFSDNSPDTVFGKLAAGIGIEADIALPTSIAGLTKYFRPGITWFGHGLQRTGTETVYDAARGFDKYLEGASDIIFHTENIQRLRILSDTIRYRFSDDGTKARVDEIRDNPNMATEDKASRISDIYNADKSSGSSFVQWMEEYTNLLANKKHESDRVLEGEFGRRIYKILTNIDNKFGANAVGANISSALTNFFPVAQSMSVLKPSSLLRAALDTRKASINDDGFVYKSDFLTNRFGSERLYKTKTDRAVEVLAIPFDIIDGVTANMLVRAAYYENVQNGMTETEAMAKADAFAQDLMAGRSKGAMPTIYNAQNPIIKLFTKFQLENANQFSFMFKDLPRYKKDEGVKAVVAALFRYAIAAYFHGMLHEKITGRQMAFNPIYLGVEAAKDFTSEELTKTQASMNLAKNFAEELPYIGGILGGGRVPISGALPNLPQVGKDVIGLASGEKDTRKGLSSLGKEFSKPLTYVLPPVGGGQAKKVIEGVAALRKGGSYSIDSQGRDVLQYPVGNKPTDIAKTLLFGKSSSPYSDDWVRSGFKGLSAKDTEEYKKKLDKGVSPEEAYDDIMAQKRENAEKTKTSKAFNERMEKEVPAFKYADEIEELTGKYKSQYPEQAKYYGMPSINISKKDRTFKANNAVYSLSDDLLIERQKTYQKIIENAYSEILKRPIETKQKMKLLEEAKKNAIDLADLQFWSKNKREIEKHKINLPPKK